MFPRSLRLLSLAALAALASCGKPTPPAPSGAGSGGAPPETLRIAVVPKGTTHDFWQSVHAGARRAQESMPGVEIVWTGPEREDDRAQQVALVENLVGSRVDAIVLAPLDDKALVAPVRLAVEAGIPVVIFDSGLDAEPGRDYVSFVATDNAQGGRLAGARMAELVKTSGAPSPRVLLLRYQEGSASTRLREEGFVEAITAAGGIELIDPGRYAGATRATAQEAAENLLATYADITGVFCPNESSTFGMLLALRARGLAGKASFIGFDSSEGLVEALREGHISALVVQNPMRMGELAVRAAVAHLRGEIVEQRIDTGVVLVSSDNIDTPEVRELIAPELDAPAGTP